MHVCGTGVDPRLYRGAGRPAAARAGMQRRRVGRCGCSHLEFDACIKLWASTSACNESYLSTTVLPHVIGMPQWRFFCGPEERDCTVELAAQRMLTRYRAIGLTEELDTRAAHSALVYPIFDLYPLFALCALLTC